MPPSPTNSDDVETFKTINNGICDLKNGALKENGDYKVKEKLILAKDIGTDYTFRREIVWWNVFLITSLHLLSIWGAFVVLSGGISLATFFFGVAYIWTTAKGVIIGAHRFYAHRCFKAHPALRAILLLLHTQAGQNCMYIWVRDHRLHHRYSDTDADPHNSNRGFFFSHVGWLMSKKHPLVKELGKTTDMSDLEADWMVMFQKKYYYWLYFVVGVLVPIGIPVYFFGETLLHAFLTTYCFRYVWELNVTWLVNSAAHLYGTRPYDKKINPVESVFVSFMTTGEGWHNYHHTFPWDYKAAELPTVHNQSAKVINLLARLGLVWDLKSASDEMIYNRIKSSGDETHFKYGNDKARAAVTAVGPLTPMNPTYNSVLRPVHHPEYLYYNADLKVR